MVSRIVSCLILDFGFYNIYLIFLYIENLKIALDDIISF
jgi:hypothetical protein